MATRAELARYLQYRVSQWLGLVRSKDEMMESKTTLKRIDLENIVALLAFAILLVSAVFWADQPPTMEKTDFSVTYIGSRMVYLGQGSKLYDLAEQQKLKKLLLPDAEPLIYEHPPFEALLLAPLGALPYKTAYLIWGLINVAIWLMLPYLLRPYAPAPRDDLGYLVLWLLFAPLGVALFQGQSSLVLLLVYSLVLVSLKQGSDFRAGAILGLGLFKFQFILPFVLIFLLRRQWRFLTGFLATAAGLGVLSVVAVGWPGIWSYVHLLASISSHPNSLAHGSAVDMATVEGFVHALLGNVLNSMAVALIVAGASTFLIIWTGWRWRKLDRKENSNAFDLMFAAAIVVALVTGFHMFAHDMSPLILAALLAAAKFPGRSQPQLRMVIGILLVVFWTPVLYIALVAWHRAYLWLPILIVFLLAILRLSEGQVSKTGAELQTV